MEKQQAIVVDAEYIEHLATLMAYALPDLDCPDCCGPVYKFIEVGARFYQEELEWAVFAQAMIHVRQARRKPPA